MQTVYLVNNQNKLNKENEINVKRQSNLGICCCIIVIHGSISNTKLFFVFAFCFKSEYKIDNESDIDIDTVFKDNSGILKTFVSFVYKGRLFFINMYSIVGIKLHDI